MQIQNCQKTETSKIPKEWTFNTLGDCCNILDHKRVPLNSEERRQIKGNIPYFGANGVQGYINKFIFDEDLVLLAEDGGYFTEYAHRPIAYYVTGKSWVNNHAHVLTSKGNNELKWIYYSLVHKNILNWIKGSTRTKLNQSELRKIPILIPPLKEQQKIVSILSNVDNLIQKTDQVIEQTQRLKKGLMQRLLTKGIGHTKFKKTEIGEIPYEWDIKRIKEIAFINPEAINESYSFKDINYLEIGSIKDYEIQNYASYNISDRPSRAQRIIKDGDIVVSTVRPYLKGFSLIDDKRKNLICSTGFAVIRLKDKNDINFLFSYIKSKYFEDALFKQMEGMAYPAVTSSDISNVSLPYPHSSKEKLKIGSILFNVDLNYKLHKSNKLKLQNLKKGLMQQLLTGKIRVKV